MAITTLIQKTGFLGLKRLFVQIVNEADDLQVTIQYLNEGIQKIKESLDKKKDDYNKFLKIRESQEGTLEKKNRELVVIKEKLKRAKEELTVLKGTRSGVRGKAKKIRESEESIIKMEDDIQGLEGTIQILPPILREMEELVPQRKNEIDENTAYILKLISAREANKKEVVIKETKVRALYNLIQRLFPRKMERIPSKFFSILPPTKKGGSRKETRKLGRRQETRRRKQK